MIELEMQLEKNCTYDTIMRLCKLYSQAIEFFDDKEDPKCFDIQSKLHSMLQRPEIKQTLSNPVASTLAPRPCSPEVKLSDCEIRQNSSSLQLSKKLEDEPKFSSGGADLVARATGRAQEGADRTWASLSKQEPEPVSQADRRRASIRKRNASMTSEIELNDPSVREFRSNMQEEVEEFLENHFASQSHAISQINLRYETEINRLDGQGGVFAMVVEQLKRNKEDEAAALMKKFESIRKETVGVIRKKYMRDFMY